MDWVKLSKSRDSSKAVKEYKQNQRHIIMQTEDNYP